jgi:hypothetical protein
MLRACGYADLDCLKALVEVGCNIDAHALACPDNATFREIACRRHDLAQVIARHEGRRLSNRLPSACEPEGARAHGFN